MSEYPCTPFHLRLIAEELSLRRSSRDPSRLNATLGAATIDLHPHQIEAAVFALQSPLSRGVILADEVGLGKTIEAGLLLAQMLAEGKRRLLVITPASIRAQWRNELLDKFGLEAELLDGPRFEELQSQGVSNPFDDDRRPLIICSLQFAYRHADEIQKVPWDLVVMDEAHYLRNAWRPDNKMGRRLRRALEDRRKVLLTATPLQNDLMELYGLISFLDERSLGTPYSFRAQYAFDDQGRDPTRIEELRRRLEPIVIRTLRRQVREYVQFTERHSWTESFTPSPQEHALYERVSEYLRRPALAAIEHGQRPLMLMVYRKLLASSTFAIKATLESLIATLEEKLAAVEAGGRVRKRHLPKIAETDYEEIEELADEFAVRSEDEHPEDQPVFFTPEEIREELEELRACHRLAAGITVNAKGEALKGALSRLFAEAERRCWPRKAVIFTESRRTQEYLYRMLSEAGHAGRITLFHGGSGDAAARRALVKQFENETDILIATRAGAEGLNLQFCNVVINYDLPWNPQRIEQRIGRCHRYGQKLDVIVVNFLNRNNAADRRLHELLDQKLRLFDGVFGYSDEILGALNDGTDFERRIFEIYQSCRTEEEINRAFDLLQKEVEDLMQARMRDARQLLLEHFDDEVRMKLRAFNRDLHVQLSEQERKLKALVRGYLGDARFRETDTPEVYRLIMPDSLKATGIASIIPAATFDLHSSHGKEGVERIHANHPLVRWIVERVREESAATIHNLLLDYTGGQHRIASVEPFLGGRGLWFVYRLSFDSLEPEDRLAHIVLLARESPERFECLPQEIARHFPGITARPHAISTPSFGPEVRARAEAELANLSAEWAREVERANENSLDIELDRLDRYTEESLMESQDRLARLRQEWEEAKRRREKAEGEERRKLREDIHRLERAYAAQLRAMNEQNILCLDEKSRREKELQARLPVRVSHNLIAVARWEMR